MHIYIYIKKKYIIKKATDKRILNLLEKGDTERYIGVYYSNSKEEVLRIANEDCKDQAGDELTSISFDKKEPFGIYKTIGQDIDGYNKYGEKNFSFIILKKEFTWIPYDLTSNKDIKVLLSSTYRTTIYNNQNVYIRPILIDSKNIYLIDTTGKINSFTPQQFLDMFKTFEGDPAGRKVEKI